jgi:hypothetical protein
MADMVRVLLRSYFSDSRTWYNCQFAPLVRRQLLIDDLRNENLRQ